MVKPKDKKIKANLDKEYGKKVGDSIFYAMANEKKLPSQHKGKKKNG